MECCAGHAWCFNEPVVYQDNGKDFCVFHAPKGHKHKVLGGEVLLHHEFKDKIFKKIKNEIDGFRVGERLCNLSGIVFEWNISFSTFNKEKPLPNILFNSARFHGIASFDNTYFSDKVYFDNVNFNEGASFVGAHFKDKASFYLTRFHKKTNAQSSTDDVYSDFTKAIFYKETDFSSSRFHKDVKFERTEFLHNASFSSARFWGSADFVDAHFGNIDIKNSQTTFSNAYFYKFAGFDSSHFYNRAEFTETHFLVQRGDKAETNFTHTQFHDEAVFVNTVFGNKESIGQRKSFFWASKFHGSAIFYFTKFYGMVDFYAAGFFADANFINCLFKNETNFEALQIEKTMRFWFIESGDKPDKYEPIELSKTTFLFTDLRLVDFKDCRFPKIEKRTVLYDEIVASKEKDIVKYSKQIRNIGLLYRRMKQKYKDGHDEAEASIWHYNEKEMFRRENILRWTFPLSFTNLYKISSGYGERPVRALMVLVLLILFWATSLGLIGVKSINHSIAQPTSIIEINFDLNKPQSRSWNSAKDILITTIQHATFSKNYKYEPSTFWGKFIHTMFRILIPIQATLFAFALRNKFRR